MKSRPARGGLRSLPATVWGLGFVSLFMDISSEMIHSLLPVFLVTTLHASATTLGLIEGLAFSGPLLAVLIMTASGGDIRLVFWLAVPAAFLAVAILGVVVHEPERVTAVSKTAPALEPCATVGSTLLGCRHRRPRVHPGAQ